MRPPLTKALSARNADSGAVSEPATGNHLTGPSDDDSIDKTMPRDNEKSAMERVFGTAELRERILAQYGELYALRDPYGRLLGPVKELGRLLQLDSTFKETTKDSAKLQRLVCRAAAEVFGTFELLQNILRYHADRTTQHLKRRKLGAQAIRQQCLNQRLAEI